MHIVESVVDKFKEEKVSPFTIISLHEPYVFSNMNLTFSHSSCGIKKLLHFGIYCSEVIALSIPGVPMPSLPPPPGHLILLGIFHFAF